MFLTFSAVLFFTMLKEAYEDYMRYKSDSELNMRETEVFDYAINMDKKVRWCDVKPGDIVRVTKDQEVPADLLIIGAPKDTVFVSTMNLDGETNLKERKVPFLIEDIASFSGRIECEEPNANLEHWDGNVISD
jgi:phospholipid-translocating ATPase